MSSGVNWLPAAMTSLEFRPSFLIFGKVREMCRITRKLAPSAKIVVGGHVAAIPGLEHLLETDHIVKGEGIAWMRRYLGEDEHARIQHPPIMSAFQLCVMGVRVPESTRTTAATIIPAAGQRSDLRITDLPGTKKLVRSIDSPNISCGRARSAVPRAPGFIRL